MNKILSIVGLVAAAIVTFLELNYYFSHPYRPGVSPHLIGLGVAVACVAVSQIIRDKPNK